MFNGHGQIEAIPKITLSDEEKLLAFKCRLNFEIIDGAEIIKGITEDEMAIHIEFKNGVFKCTLGSEEVPSADAEINYKKYKNIAQVQSSLKKLQSIPELY